MFLELRGENLHAVPLCIVGPVLESTMSCMGIVRAQFHGPFACLLELLSVSIEIVILMPTYGHLRYMADAGNGRVRVLDTAHLG